MAPTTIGDATLYLGDCLDVLRTLPDASVDSVVTDPPYGLAFMGKRWDYDVPSVEIWAECLRVLKPGGHLLAFAGTRTQHRMAVRIEDAGFEIRDMLAWLYGSGFPKSLDVSKAIDAQAGAEREVIGSKVGRPGYRAGETAANYVYGDGLGNGTASSEITAPATDAAKQWDGWGTALKPALEPITLARKPLAGTVAANVLAHGTGGLNIAGCRIDHNETLRTGAGTTWDAMHKHEGREGEPSAERTYADKGGTNFAMTPGPRGGDPDGRWPANVLHDGSVEVLAHFPDAPGQLYAVGPEHGDKASINTYGDYGPRDNFAPRNDTGSAARFFKECTWQDHDQQQLSAGTAEQNLSLQKAVDGFALNAAATWPNLAGIQSNDAPEPSTNATPNELNVICNLVTAAIAIIGSECSREQRLEKHSPCGSLVKVVAAKNQTDTMTITASLYRLDGFVAHATSNITPINLAHGVAASRIKYCAKASKADRDEGLELSPTHVLAMSNQAKAELARGNMHATGSDMNTAKFRKNHHPTVKPTELMRYLLRLVTPPGGTALDPFMGSGSTGKAALLEHFKFIGIERDPDYFEIAKARIDYIRKSGVQVGLFGEAA